MYGFRKEMLRVAGSVTSFVRNRRNIFRANSTSYTIWRQRRLSYEQQSL